MDQYYTNKGKVVPVKTIQADWGSRSTAAHILYLGTRTQVIGQLCVLAALPSKELQYPSNRRLGDPGNQFQQFWRRENLLPLPGFEP